MILFKAIKKLTLNTVSALDFFAALHYGFCSHIFRYDYGIVFKEL